MYIEMRIFQVNAGTLSPRVLGESAREVLRKTQQELAQAKVNLGEAYSFFILGLGHRSSHHTQQGR